MEFGVLGPLLVRDATGPVSLTSPKQRALLATLLLETGHDVSANRLIDEIWGVDPPASAGKALQVHVSQLRRVLGREQPIVTRPTGYGIQIEPGGFDLHLFEASLAQSRRMRAAGDPAGALDALNEALGLWRGPALADVTLRGPSATEANRLEGLRSVAQDECMELRLAQVDAAALVPELEALIASDPYRERRHGLLMLALYRAGRQADALAAFRRARTMLVLDLGLEPGAELVRLEAAILTQDPSLDLPETVAQPAGNAHRGGIPGTASAILGREPELRAALALIERPDVRLVTLTGAGGIGKTRLALELATRIGARARVVDLSAITDPERVMTAISAAIGALDGTADAVAAALGREPIVLFLDNFEQLLAAAPAVAWLVSAVTSLTIVVTSRAPLRVTAEQELPVPPLARGPAVALFVRRAGEQDPRFSPGPDDLDSIAAICGRVDGLPLAIELAAARTRVLTLGEILDRIARRLDLLTTGRRDAPERHRTLRATIAWSHDLLDPEEQRLFAHLAVFQSGSTLDAIEAVTGADVLDTLSALVDHSLVIRDTSRFRMLETVREFAAERLEDSYDGSAARRRHALWCLALAEAAEPDLEGPNQAASFARLDPEQENLRTAAAWAVTNDEPEIALGLDGALWRFWLARGAAAEVRAVLSSALASGRGEPGLRAKALNAAGVVAGASTDFADARVLFDAALELATELGDRRQIARTLMNLGVVALYTEDYVTALARYEEAGAIWQELGDLRGQSVMRQNMATVHGMTGQFEQAMPLLEQSLELARAAGDGMQIAATLVELARQLVQYRSNDPRIPGLLREGLELVTALEERRHIIECLEVLAALSARTGAPATGAQLIGAADAERARAGAERQPDERPLFEATVRELEQALGREAYERARDRGRRKSRLASIELALKTTERRPEPA